MITQVKTGNFWDFRSLSPSDMKWEEKRIIRGIVELQEALTTLHKARKIVCDEIDKEIGIRTSLYENEEY